MCCPASHPVTGHLVAAQGLRLPRPPPPRVRPLTWRDETVQRAPSAVALTGEGIDSPSRVYWHERRTRSSARSPETLRHSFPDGPTCLAEINPFSPTVAQVAGSLPAVAVSGVVGGGFWPSMVVCGGVWWCAVALVAVCSQSQPACCFTALRSSSRDFPFLAGTLLHVEETGRACPLPHTLAPSSRDRLTSRP